MRHVDRGFVTQEDAAIAFGNRSKAAASPVGRGKHAERVPRLGRGEGLAAWVEEARDEVVQAGPGLHKGAPPHLKKWELDLANEESMEARLGSIKERRRREREKKEADERERIRAEAARRRRLGHEEVAKARDALQHRQGVKWHTLCIRYAAATGVTIGAREAARVVFVGSYEALVKLKRKQEELKMKRLLKAAFNLQRALLESQRNSPRWLAMRRDCEELDEEVRQAKQRYTAWCRRMPFWRGTHD